MTNRIWILGAADQEMAAIESLLTECGERFAHATISGRRVTAGEAYRAECPTELGDTVYRVECAWDGCVSASVATIDHHEPGHPGHCVPASDFLRGSSLGQVITELARLDVLPEEWGELFLGVDPSEIGQFAFDADGQEWGVRARAADVEMSCLSGCCGYYAHASVKIPIELVLTAAADHCLAAAYAGQCPGVTREALLAFRAREKAAFISRKKPGITEETVRADIDRAITAIQSAPTVSLSGSVTAVDMRGQRVNELPEAAAVIGTGFVADGLPGPDGRRKIILQSATPEQIAAWPDFARAIGLVDCYGGDPARGFAGGYLPANGAADAP